MRITLQITGMLCCNISVGSNNINKIYIHLILKCFTLSCIMLRSPYISQSHSFHRLLSK
jgi:hypothetical protein